MDPVIHLSEEHRSDMLLDQSGLTREERVVVQASISNECDFDSRRSYIHGSISARIKDERRAKAKTDPNVLIVRTLVGFAEKGRSKHPGSGKSGTSAHHANLTSVEDYDYYYDEDIDESANSSQAHNDPFDPRSDDGEEAPDYDGEEENDTFLRMLLWTMLLFSRQLNWTLSHFSLRHGTMILIPR